MIVHQCDSCKTPSRASATAAVSLPFGWSSITISRVSGTAITYELCEACSDMPMAFGNVKWGNS